MSSLQTLVRVAGVKAVTKSTEERFLRLLLDSDDSHPVLLNFITHLAATDMYFLEALVSEAELVAKDPEFIAGLLRAAFVCAGEGRGREFIRRLAAKTGLTKSLPREGAVDLTSLTPSQLIVYDHLRAVADTFFHYRGSPSPVKLRLNSLIVGCSGVGKSFLAQLLAQELNLRYLELTVGSWIPVGARQSPTTIETITEALGTDAPLLIFLDELDKHRAQDNAWSLGHPLMMLVAPFAICIYRIALTKFVEHSRRESRVDDIVGVVPYHCGSRDLHALPLPALQSKHFLVELVWKALGPFRPMVTKVFLQDRLESVAVTDLLVAGGLINQRDDTHLRDREDEILSRNGVGIDRGAGN